MSSRHRRPPRQIRHRSEFDRETSRLRNSGTIWPAKTRPILNACTAGWIRPDAERKGEHGDSERSSKSQAPSSREIPSSKYQTVHQTRSSEFGVWILELLWDLDLGHWSFEPLVFGAPGFFRSWRK